MLSTLLPSPTLPLFSLTHIHFILFSVLNNAWFYYYSPQSLPSSSICFLWVVLSVVLRRTLFYFFSGVKGKRSTRWLRKNTGMWVCLDTMNFAISPISLLQLHLSFWVLLVAYKAPYEHFISGGSGCYRSLLIQSPCLWSVWPLRMCKSSRVCFSAVPLSSFGKLPCLQGVGTSCWFIG